MGMTGMASCSAIAKETDKKKKYVQRNAYGLMSIWDLCKTVVHWHANFYVENSVFYPFCV